jgi:hypothetical protein
MKSIISALLALCALLAAQAAQAGGISDVGVNAYWGADSHNRGDVIGDSDYDISGATITRVGSVLTVTINTNFAGKAGMDSQITTGGIGYGDVFLAQNWNPFGSDSHHAGDNAANGTNWQWAFKLDNRYSNSGGTFKLYALNGTNAEDTRTSDYYMNCNGCVYRDGQVTGVNTSAGSKASYQNIMGNWSVSTGQLKFQIDVSSSAALMSYTTFAMHWGETCQNDVIEGITSVVPSPGSLPLLAIGLGALIAFRRKGRSA